MKTQYSNINQIFTDEAHLAAQEKIYPCLFNTTKRNMKFITTSLSGGGKDRVLDGDMAIDRIIKVKVDWFRAPLEFTVQERFRRHHYAKFKDLTITEWNEATDLKSELFKLNAGIFLYGYYLQEKMEFVDWIAINTVGLLLRIAARRPRIKRETNKRSQQTFLTFKFDDLHRAGLVLASHSDYEACIRVGDLSLSTPLN